MIYNLAKDFSKIPFGRHTSDGANSAERLRNILIPLLIECKEKNEILTVELDDVPIGIPSSFLEEGFAGIIRNSHFTSNDLRTLLFLDTEDKSYIEEVNSYIDDLENVK